jgi:hypothetical protein
LDDAHQRSKQELGNHLNFFSANPDGPAPPAMDWNSHFRRYRSQIVWLRQRTGWNVLSPKQPLGIVAKRRTTEEEE